MTDLVEVALIASIPPTVAALCGLALGIVNHRQGSAIHVLVNSKMTEATAKIQRLEQALKTSEAKERDSQ